MCAYTMMLAHGCRVTPRCMTVDTARVFYPLGTYASALTYGKERRCVYACVCVCVYVCVSVRADVRIGVREDLILGGSQDR